MINQDVKNNICTIQLCNGKANTINEKLILRLKDVLDEAKVDENIYGVIITGKDHFFSTGADIETILNLKTEKNIVSFFRILDELIFDLFSFPKPLISAINGHSIGGGLLIQMCSDYCFVIKNEKIKFGFPEIKIGMSLDSLMEEVISFVIDNKKTVSKILYSGNLFTTEDAIEYQIIDEIFDTDELIIKSREKILKLVSGNIESFCALKKVIRKKALTNMANYLCVNDYSDFVKLLGNKKTIIRLKEMME